jgi:hypothetical protein
MFTVGIDERPAVFQDIKNVLAHKGKKRLLF